MTQETHSPLPIVNRLEACQIEFSEGQAASFGPPINPDGPEAATLIKELVEALEFAQKCFAQLLDPATIIATRSDTVWANCTEADTRARTALAKAREVMK